VLKFKRKFWCQRVKDNKTDMAYSKHCIRKFPWGWGNKEQNL